MQIDFGEEQGPGVEDYVTVPAGTYLCEVAEVRTGTTRHGAERWSLRLVVAEGEFVGRQAAWDGLSFTDRGQGRVRLVFRALGLPTEGLVDVKHQDLEGRRAFVEIRPSEYANPDTGRVVRRNEVPYDGYRSLEPSSERAPVTGEPPPF